VPRSPACNTAENSNTGNSSGALPNLPRVRPWEHAWEDALYGPDGFYVTGRGAPGRDYRTSATTGRAFAAALARLAVRVDVLLGHPPSYDVVEVGAGGGALLCALRAALPAGLRRRARFTAVERAPRPPGLSDDVAWTSRAPSGVTGLLVANEWLDNVPCPVVAVDGHGVRRVVLVDATGRERLGPEVGPREGAWLDREWPVAAPGERAEVGLPRERAWATAVGSLVAGLAVAVDYATARGARPAGGTLRGYRRGRAVPPVPDGTCDLTAGVALDGCAAAWPGARLLPQRVALRALGVGGPLPARARATADPARYLRSLASAGEARELLEPAGLGGFGWLLVGAGRVDPGAALPIPPQPVLLR